MRYYCILSNSKHDASKGPHQPYKAPIHPIRAAHIATSVYSAASAKAVTAYTQAASGPLLCTGRAVPSWSKVGIVLKNLLPSLAHGAAVKTTGHNAYHAPNQIHLCLCNTRHVQFYCTRRRQCWAHQAERCASNDLHPNCTTSRATVGEQNTTCQRITACVENCNKPYESHRLLMY
jgi:hypothetical protein